MPNIKDVNKDDSTNFNSRFFKFFEKIKEKLIFFEQNKFVIGMISYGIGILLQMIILFFILGFVGLNYISFSFSLDLSLIVLLILFISIPSMVILLIGLFIFSTLNIWNSGGLFGKIMIVCSILVLVVIITIRLKAPNKLEYMSKLYPEMLIKFYLKALFVMFLIIFIGFIITIFSFKVANIKTSEEKYFGKYMFYNKDYYFLDICGKKLILPSDEVKSVEIRMSYFDLTDFNNKDKVNALNKEYNDFCIDYLNKNDGKRNR